MLIADEGLIGQGIEAVRFATPDSLDEYSSAANNLQAVEAHSERLLAARTLIDVPTALEESFFLGLRMVRGVSLSAIAERFGPEAVCEFEPDIAELMEVGLLERTGEVLCLTSRGRLLSNEVFARLIRERHPV
jgi:oxygen-independent coproporphyrinogen-3 oxidase